MKVNASRRFFHLVSLDLQIVLFPKRINDSGRSIGGLSFVSAFPPEVSHVLWTGYKITRGDAIAACNSMGVKRHAQSVLYCARSLHDKSMIDQITTWNAVACHG
jgi:hypothetical protein